MIHKIGLDLHLYFIVIKIDMIETGKEVLYKYFEVTGVTCKNVAAYQVGNFRLCF